MRWSPERLRWLLLGGVVALAALLAAVFGLSSYRAGKIWQRILARNGVNIRQESNGITYSQSRGGRTLFTIHAAHSVPHGKGQWTLHDAVMILYGKNGRDDRISGSEFEYDEHGGVLRAVGEVHLDLDAPTYRQSGEAPSLTFAPGDATARDPELIHVRTSGLVYLRKLDVAATDQPTEFRYKGITCTSRGAEFDTGKNTLRLLADVQMTGLLQAQPFQLTAAQSVLDQGAGTVELWQPTLTSGDRAGRAEHATLHLRKGGELVSGDGIGDVVLRDGTATVTGPRMHALFGSGNRLQAADFTDGARFNDTDPRRPTQGVAQTAELHMGAAGLLQALSASGAVQLETDETAQPATRRLAADTLNATFAAAAAKGSSRPVLQTALLTGHASVELETPASGTRPGATTHVRGDRLQMQFARSASGQAEPQRLQGNGHTEVEQASTAGSHTLSLGQTLAVDFAPRDGSGAGAATDSGVAIADATQTGAVVVQSTTAPAGGKGTAATSVGHGDRAVYVAAEGTVTLTGAQGRQAEMEQAPTTVRAQTITLHQGTGEAEASGAVAATTAGDPGGDPQKTAGLSAAGAQVTHVLAARAHLMHEQGLSEFFGTAAQPAQLWQGGSQVEAAKLVLDGPKHSLSARPATPTGQVHAVFAAAGRAGTGAVAKKHPGQGEAAASGRPGRFGPPEAGSGTPADSITPAARDVVEVSAGALDFSDPQHEAFFSGGVTLRDAAGVVTGDHGAAFLAPPRTAPAAAQEAIGAVPAVGGELERLVLLGDVRLRQGARTGTGTQLTYTAASGQYVLTGTAENPPHLFDPQQGTVTGPVLVFRPEESSIVVGGGPGGVNQTKPARVHTETDLKPQ